MSILLKTLNTLLILSIFLISCSRENQAPVAAFTIEPETGTNETIFWFDASTSSDPDDAADDLMVRWDWEGDGTFDTQYAVKKRSDHKYSKPGTYQVILSVKDLRGLVDTVSRMLVVTSSNMPPEQPFDPRPEDGAADLGAKQRIYWDCSDPDGDPVLYTVHFGTTNPPPVHLNNYTFKTFDPGKLEFGTTYYWRIRARDIKGNVTEGPLWTFTTIDIDFAEITDARDGKSYSIVQIGSQWWMAQNLNYQTAEGSFCYENDPNRCNLYGRLYTWDAALNACPDGWHLPSKEEFETLVAHLGGAQVAGGKMKDYETGYWIGPNTGANNLSGFTALPAGRRYEGGLFAGLSFYAQYYSSTEYNNREAFTLMLGYDYANSFIYNYRKTYAVSVRCIKNGD